MTSAETKTSRIIQYLMHIYMHNQTNDYICIYSYISKKTLWPFFMDKVKLPRGYRSTTRQFIFSQKSPLEFLKPRTNFSNKKSSKVKNTADKSRKIVVKVGEKVTISCSSRGQNRCI